MWCQGQGKKPPKSQNYTLQATRISSKIWSVSCQRWGPNNFTNLRRSPRRWVRPVCQKAVHAIRFVAMLEPVRNLVASVLMICILCFIWLGFVLVHCECWNILMMFAIRYCLKEYFACLTSKRMTIIVMMVIMVVVVVVVIIALLFINRFEWRWW